MYACFTIPAAEFDADDWPEGDVFAVPDDGSVTVIEPVDKVVYEPSGVTRVYYTHGGNANLADVNFTVTFVSDLPRGARSLAHWT